MPERPADPASLQRALNALQAAHPELDPLAALVLLALDEQPPSENGVSSALLARYLEIEHALIRRACTTLEEAGWIRTQPAGGASPALRVCWVASL
ncbi:MarR family transcriptional regulator [Halomonas aquamarina]|uniref:MarR family transcriptional regulator n=1 Tax=Vreelandella aquamarina TaxID=77097 RepID=A0ACC5VUK4_9GAMM|nr:MarR family transcriptional regulator [Halomonas aquamarina]MBZ5487645.1 MarR family transcriptional regulator [Halomonas aquamarina]